MRSSGDDNARVRDGVMVVEGEQSSSVTRSRARRARRVRGAVPPALHAPDDLARARAIAMISEPLPFGLTGEVAMRFGLVGTEPGRTSRTDRASSEHPTPTWGGARGLYSRQGCVALAEELGVERRPTTTSCSTGRRGRLAVPPDVQAELAFRAAPRASTSCSTSRWPFHFNSCARARRRSQRSRLRERRALHRPLPRERCCVAHRGGRAGVAGRVDGLAGRTGLAGQSLPRVAVAPGPGALWDIGPHVSAT